MLLNGRTERKPAEPQPKLRDDDGGVEEFTLKVGGQRFFCSCGCNVFHKPDDRDLDLYQCNSCQTRYRAE